MMVAGSKGATEIAIGTRFQYGGCAWEVVAFSGATYSPSTLGGTPTFRCKPHGTVSKFDAQWMEPDGTIEFCGDSVATMILQAREP